MRKQQGGSPQAGSGLSQEVASRLSDIEAAANVRELPPLGNPHPLVGDRQGQFSVSLVSGKRLVFQPDDDPAPIRQDGGIDWSEVTAVTIVFIGDYHD